MNALMTVAAVSGMLLTRLASGSDVDFGVTESSELVVNSRGSSEIATAVLSDTAGIVCYLDWKYVNNGWCRALDLSRTPAAPTQGGEQVKREMDGFKLKHFSLARFSDTQAVVCYVRVGSDGQAVCYVLEVQESDWSLTEGPKMTVDPNSIYLQQIDVASLTPTMGVVCYGDTDSNLKVKCLPFNLNANTLALEKGTADNVDTKVHHVESLSVTAFTDNTAVVCYAMQDEHRVPTYLADGSTIDLREGSWCIPISTDGSALTVPADGHVPVTGDGKLDVWGDFSKGLAHNLLTARLTEDTGVVCYVDDADGSSGKCQPLSLTGGKLVVHSEVLVVNPEATSYMTLAGMSDTAAIVCYATGADQVGKCNGLVLSHGTELAMGEDTPIGDDAAFSSAYDCQWETCGGFMSVSANAAPLNMIGLACYAGVGGSEEARCSVLAVPPPTATTTATSITETTSTTPHTTTKTSSATSSTTETSSMTMTTTANTFSASETTSTTSTTTATTSTNPHTTKETSVTSVTSVTEALELSAAAPAAAVTGAAAAAALAWMAALL